MLASKSIWNKEDRFSAITKTIENIINQTNSRMEKIEKEINEIENKIKDINNKISKIEKQTKKEKINETEPINQKPEEKI